MYDWFPDLQNSEDASKKINMGPKSGPPKKVAYLETWRFVGSKDAGAWHVCWFFSATSPGAWAFAVSRNFRCGMARGRFRIGLVLAYSLEVSIPGVGILKNNLYYGDLSYQEGWVQMSWCRFVGYGSLFVPYLGQRMAGLLELRLG